MADEGYKHKAHTMALYLTMQVVVLHSKALTPMGSEMWVEDIK